MCHKCVGRSRLLYRCQRHTQRAGMARSHAACALMLQCLAWSATLAQCASTGSVTSWHGESRDPAHLPATAAPTTPPRDTQSPSSTTTALSLAQETWLRRVANGTQDGATWPDMSPSQASTMLAAAAAFEAGMESCCLPGYLIVDAVWSGPNRAPPITEWDDCVRVACGDGGKGVVCRWVTYVTIACAVRAG